MTIYSTLKKLTPLVILLLISTGIWSIPARPTPIQITQSDGTTITLYVKGDENFHYLTSEDGYMVLENNQREYVYAYQDEKGNYNPSSFLVKPVSIRTAEEISFLEKQAKGTSIRQTSNRVKKNTPQNGGILSGIFPPKVLVILAEFKDISILNYEFVVPDAKQTFTRLFNEEGYSYDGATGSVRDYFYENSNGLYDPEFTVVGPVKLPQTKSYYGNNVQGYDIAPATMVYHACLAAAELQEINFSDFDSDSDGEVDAVIVIYSGLSEADGAPEVNIWPIAGTLEEMNPYEKEEIYPLILDEVLINRFIASSELRGAEGTDITGIGTVTHELGHVLGLPDLYDTTNGNGGLLGWSLMANGSYNNDGRTPPYLSAYEREALEWGEPILLTITGEYELSSIETNQFYRINASDNDTEYFLLENRQQQGWDEPLKGHGMLIYHIDLSDPDVYYENRVNADPDHPYVTIKAADGILHQNNYEGDPFPGDTGKTRFDDRTSPSSVLWTGELLEKPLFGIEETEKGIIRFQFEGLPDAIRNYRKEAKAYVLNQTLHVQTEANIDRIEIYENTGIKYGTFPLQDGKTELKLPSNRMYLIKIGLETYKFIL